MTYPRLAKSRDELIATLGLADEVDGQPEAPLIDLQPRIDPSIHSHLSLELRVLGET